MGIREDHGHSDGIESKACSQFHTNVASSDHHCFTSLVGLHLFHQIVGVVYFSQVVDASSISSRGFEVSKIDELQCKLG